MKQDQPDVAGHRRALQTWQHYMEPDVAVACGPIKDVLAVRLANFQRMFSEPIWLPSVTTMLNSASLM